MMVTRLHLRILIRWRGVGGVLSSSADETLSSWLTLDDRKRERETALLNLTASRWLDHMKVSEEIDDIHEGILKEIK